MSTNIYTAPDYTNQKEQLLRLVENFDIEGELIVKGSRNIIKSNFIDSEKVTIKYFKKPNFFNALIYRFIRKSKAKRSFDYALYLLKNHILTPAPVAYIENTAAGLADSYYICKHIDYDFTFRELIHDPLFKDRENILRQFTVFTFKMHEGRINFLDHSPGNTLIVDKKDGTYDFYLIDLNRMRFQNLSVEQRMDNFKKLWLSKTMVKIIAEEYAVLSGEPYEKLHTLLLQKTLDFKKKITRKKYLKRKLKKK